MPVELSADLSLLLWSVALCFVQVVIAVIAAQGQVGLAALVGNREGIPHLTGLAGRARRAHRNMLESLVLFAALTLIAHVSGRANDLTLVGGYLFFWARAAYAIVYLVGLPWIRTGLWSVSVLGLLLMFVELL
jgi:uncharacterized MAPEG superfamily protein